MSKYERKTLKKLMDCLPDNWVEFYKQAPAQFGQEYLDQMGMSRDEFLEMAKCTWLFDYYFYEHDATDQIYKHAAHYGRHMLLPRNHRKLWDALPDEFDRETLRRTRIDLGLPIIYQDDFTCTRIKRPLYHRLLSASYPEGIVNGRAKVTIYKKCRIIPGDR